MNCSKISRMSMVWWILQKMAINSFSFVITSQWIEWSKVRKVFARRISLHDRLLFSITYVVLLSCYIMHISWQSTIQLSITSNGCFKTCMISHNSLWTSRRKRKSIITWRRTLQLEEFKECLNFNNLSTNVKIVEKCSGHYGLIISNYP